MRKVLAAILVSCLFSPFAGAAYDEECLVIGQQVEPVRARRLWGESLAAWRLGHKTEALQKYEQALIADRSVLRHDDEGMARLLMDRYQELIDAGATSTALLCRYAFFENVIAGDLETSIGKYREAAREAGVPRVKEQALREVTRLEAELTYIQRWQAEFQRKQAIARARDLAQYDKQQRLSTLDERIQALQDESDELDERLAYLSEQEKTTSDEAYSAMKRGSRYRRRTYYPEFTEGPENDPLLEVEYGAPPEPPFLTTPGPLVGGSFSGPNVSGGISTDNPTGTVERPSVSGIIPPGNARPPVSGIIPPSNPSGIIQSGSLPGIGSPNLPTSTTTPARTRYLHRMYRLRNEADDLQHSLASIRAEMAGINRRKDQIAREIKKIEKQRREEEKTKSFPTTP